MGHFITLEGIEGAGKSTLRARLADELRQFQTEIVLTREPGSTHLGQAIRSMVLDPANRELDAIAELMLFQADRAQHVREIIRPALARGAIVICDRYVHSTLAYQGYGRGLDLNQLKALNEFTTGKLMPDLVILLDLDPKLGLTRVTRRTRKASGSFRPEALLQSVENAQVGDRFEQQSLEFHRAIRNGFLELARETPERFAVIDASGETEVVVRDALSAVTNFMSQRSTQQS